MQQDFFDSLMNDPLEAENAPCLDMSLDIKAVINQCLRNSPLSRDQIVDRINLCLRTRETKQLVTTRSLNHWVSPSQTNAVPAWVLPALCWALQSDAPFKALLQPLGRKVIDNRGDTMREMTEKRLQASEQMKQAKALEKQMQQMLEGKY